MRTRPAGQRIPFAAVFVSLMADCSRSPLFAFGPRRVLSPSGRRRQPSVSAATNGSEVARRRRTPAENIRPHSPIGGRAERTFSISIR